MEVHREVLDEGFDEREVVHEESPIIASPGNSLRATAGLEKTDTVNEGNYNSF